MKFTIHKADLEKVLLAVNKSLLSKSNLPILANIMVSASRERLEVLSTDLETATRAWLKCKVEKEGQTTLPGRILTEFISQLPDQELVFEKLGQEVLLTTKGFSARLATMAPEDFPAIPKIEKGHHLEINGGELAQAVLRVAFSAAADEGRPVLTGVLCEVEKTTLTMVATDGYRLSFQKTPLINKEGVSLKMIIPAKTLVEVGKLVSEMEKSGEESVNLVVSESLNQINFKVGNVEFTSRLIEGEFPGWQKIIPEKFTSRAIIGREELMRQIRIASIFARDSGSIVRFKLESSGKGKAQVLKIMASNNQVGSNETSCEIELTGGGGEIAFNFRYLLEMLSSVSTDEVNFEMIESLNPGKLTIPGDNNYFHIIMPVRLQS